jgi:hypothetical protein
VFVSRRAERQTPLSEFRQLLKGRTTHTVWIRIGSTEDLIDFDLEL